MLNKLFSFLLLLVAAGVPAAFAFCEEETPYLERDKRVYATALNLCSNISMTNLQGYKNGFGIAYQSAKEAMTKGHFFSLNSKLNEIYINPWFEKALEKCFPGDLFLKTMFMAQLKRLDWEGKVVGGYGLYYMYRSVRLILQGLKELNSKAYEAAQFVQYSMIGLAVVAAIKNQSSPPTVDDAVSMLHNANDPLNQMVLDEIERAQTEITQQRLNPRNASRVIELNNDYIDNENLKLELLMKK